MVPISREGEAITDRSPIEQTEVKILAGKIIEWFENYRSGPIDIYNFPKLDHGRTAFDQALNEAYACTLKPKEIKRWLG